MRIVCSFLVFNLVKRVVKDDAHVMVFIKVLGTGCLVVEATTVSQVEESVRDLWPSTDFILTLNGRRVDENSVLGSDAVLTAAPRLPGGKGGFGSMLRALGAQIEKTTNKEACRDLSGRRLRDINEEDRLKKYVAKRAEREREAQEKKEAKLASLKRLVEGENKHEFRDPKYSKEREEATERVHDAMAQGRFTDSFLFNLLV